MNEMEIAAEVITQLEAAAWRANEPHFVDAVSRVCAVTLGLEPLSPPVGTMLVSDDVAVDATAWRSAADLDDSWRIALAFAEQFVIDVTGITDADRGALGEAFGARTGEVVFLIYVADLVPRVRSVLAQLSGDRAGSAAPTDEIRSPGTPSGQGEQVESLWPAVDEFIRAVARLDTLDPVTSELVRLRGARQHECRRCKSLRNRTAMLAGADDEMFASVDAYRDGATVLSARHVAALELTDAMIWTPGRMEESTITAVRSEFDDAEQVELVLDIMRNAANKIAVSLAADGADVDEGYEIYDLGSDGDPVYGLTLD